MDTLREHISVHNMGADAEGKAVVSLSFVDLVGFTAKITAWVGKVVEAMRASGRTHMHVDPNEALTLYLAGTDPESAAAAMLRADPEIIADDAVRVDDPSPPAVSLDVAHLPDAWTGADLKCRLRSYPAAPPDADALSCHYAATLMSEAADEIDRLERIVASDPF